MSSNSLPSVAICNHVADLIDIVAEHLEAAGYASAKLHIEDIQKGRVDFVSWLKKHDPKVVIYDVAPPYKESLNFLALVQGLGAMQDRCVILTTTNLRALQQERHGIVAHEMLGKPYELGTLIKTIKEKCAHLQPEAA